MFPFSGGTKNQTVVDGDLTRGEDAETISRPMALKTSREKSSGWRVMSDQGRIFIFFTNGYLYTDGHDTVVKRIKL